MKQNKTLLVIGSILGMLVLSVVLAYASYDSNVELQIMDSLSENPILEQKSTTKLEEPVKVLKMYHKDKLVGIVSSQSHIMNVIDGIYERDYKEEFPDAKLDISQDIYYTEALSYNLYENIDDQILAYMEENQLYAVQVDKVTFSNNAVIYVKNRSDFEKARKAFLLNFVDEASYNVITDPDKKVASLQSYGEQIVDLNVKETITFEKGTTSIDNIMLTEDKISQFLSYGYEPEINTYTTVEFDSVDSVAMFNNMTPRQLVIINPGKLKDETQILVPGTELNISTFNSPFTVSVEKERLTKEVIAPPEPKIIKDDSLPEGRTVVEVVEQDGYRDSTYLDTYVNGTPTDSVLQSTKVIEEPVQSVKRVGTYVEPSVGSGRFGWPMSNAKIICRYGCYRGHQGVDFASRSNGGYGPIGAVDRGVVVKNAYNHGGWGYYIVIDHGNGYRSLYAHMASPGYYSVGSTVSRGANIGQVGMTGRTTAPHVHLEIYENGRKIDACRVIGC
ncbi:peptidoglycan DD-metalloendopeptidase family protein [Erysipelothrix sp. HDW6A]|uniref:peptidoglycan DD-metalloendopeptidase family protein n=1 Tax=Erysipelothrix sp. HDW6A TaxID=2714928 RepID=UPI001408C757|nr:M23 family metallopeptidase [Erysipelothrix sp. HDW6A]QIK57094.1 peptidoglycan DD-metalloendopeptidase family protein [Erysipelothrix sp. HDW6A]